ncbi:unnamed protein product [Vitrella brassicaformis CCMP3155]|uniref:1-(5-phosphoribosyl)-5-[(5-phosphoribosylamino)methylideneamino]imidazole-4-carboxamideisomerase n=2 Tax=Vitrella brassicaformis TaxID=1169539 RepID=A0A0G4G0Y7_VITBC|nr:unnamed protein product [Vitrella brassicaformis CCMP3155]|eukprot:CEM21636.1 unnamed protein product [Vitrella brassicaformis CCMP3155]
MPTHFRPCIDLHNGSVKQIVGGTLTDDTHNSQQSASASSSLKTNFVAPPEQDAAHFARIYRRDGLVGGHLIKLGPNNDAAAVSALEAWPHGLQVGGGVTDVNALQWLEKGASKVIVTSWLFPDGKLSFERLMRLSKLVSPDRLVVDLSCRRVDKRGEGGELGWVVAMNRWQTLTDFWLTKESLAQVAAYCSEFLVHAADVEGLCRGIDEELVAALGEWSGVPCTYAGGGRDLSDLQTVDRLSKGRVDLTFGSALDIFGGALVKYDDCVRWNREHPR